MAKVNLARGMRDILPTELRKRRKVIQHIQDVFEEYGFEALETPAVERIETLMGKYGDEGNKLIFRILARGKEGEEGKTDLALRYDLTVPLARVVAMNQQLTFPFKRYQIQPVWRADRPQKGRFREFFQCDVDVVGTESILAEAECLSVVYHSLIKLGFNQFLIRLNDRRILRQIVIEMGAEDHEISVLVAIDKLDKVGESGVRDILEKDGFSTEQIDQLFVMLNTQSVPGIEHVLSELESIQQMAFEMGVSTEHIAIDFTLARGLDYYTGPVFETVLTDANIGSVSGGGRYDGLIGMFGKQNIPAVGVSLGLERLITIMEERGMLSEDCAAVDVWVTVFDESCLAESLRIATEFRKAKIRTMTTMGYKKIGKQFKDAQKAGVRWVVVCGSGEIERGVLQLKDLQNGSQEEIVLSEAIQRVLGQ